MRFLVAALTAVLAVCWAEIIEPASEVEVTRYLGVPVNFRVCLRGDIEGQLPESGTSLLLTPAAAFLWKRRRHSRIGLECIVARKERNSMRTRTALLAAAFCAVAFSQLGLAQIAPPTILQIDVENVVQYQVDTSDLSRFATNPNVTIAVQPKNFNPAIVHADIVAVNGQPAKGTLLRSALSVNFNPAANSGQGIADIVANAAIADFFVIMNADRNIIGTIVASGFAGGSPPPGGPLSITANNFAITGGTGAFLGARGQYGTTPITPASPVRVASVTEDPANRRINGGGRQRWVLQVIPMSLPQIVSTPNGPAVTHSSDFTLVTASKPAVAGEILSLFVNGLGPTVPAVDPGKPFPSSPLAIVNSPVQVTVNGNPAQLIGAAGYPGAADGYQVNFQVPPGTAKGLASVQVSAAWIAGPTVNISIQ